MRLFNILQQLIQPDGQIINCYASGDEYFNYLHDENGYIIVQDENTGFYKYANYINGQLVPSQYTIKNNINNEIYINNTYENLVTIKDIKLPLNKGFNILSSDIEVKVTPNQGSVVNLVVFIRFSDEVEFTNQISTYNTMFNDSTNGVSSVQNYFKETSYQQLVLNSYFYPQTPTTQVVSYQDTNPRAYYQPYNVVTNPIGYQNDTQRRDREHILLKNAINAISPQVNPALNIDIDNDGIVDSICFIVKGSPGGWNSLLWPHQWSLYSQNAYINGIRVLDYTFQLDATLDVSVLCHEISHSIGAPDLYHYNFDGAIPVGPWDIMEYNLSPPQHSTAYLKYRYMKWINNIPEITTSGTYTLNPLTSPINNAYKFKSPLSTTEYFVVEYRKRNTVFENSLPGSGLIVYRINTTKDGQGNAGGPPDEVYVFRPGGTTTSNGQINDAYLTSDVGRDSIGGPSNPLFLSNGQSVDIRLFNITSAGDTISFDIAFPSQQADLSITKTASPNPVYLGNILEYTIEVTNISNVVATNVSVVDTLSTDVAFLSATTTKGSYNVNNNILTFNIGDLALSEKVTITIIVRTLKVGTVINNAVVTASNMPLSKSASTTSQVIKKGTTLSTGEICNCKCKVLIICIKNSTDTTVEIPMYIKSFNDCKQINRSTTIYVDSFGYEVINLCYLLQCYEIIFENVIEGVEIKIKEVDSLCCHKQCRNIALTEI